MQATVRVPGILMMLGGEGYVVPPLSLGTLEQMQDRLAGFTGAINDMAQVGTVIDATHAALKRNYPDITRDKVADFIDVANMADVFEALMDVSGLKRKAQEADKQGEAPAGS